MARTAPVSGSIAISAACSGSRGVLRFGSDFSISAMLCSTAASAARCMYGIDRRVDLQPALLDTLGAELLDQLAPHFVLEVLAVRFFGAQAVVDLDLRLERACRIRRA